LYIHLGRNTVVARKDIVAVFDLDNSSQSHLTRDYLARAEREGRVINVSEDLPKAFVLCFDDRYGQRIYLTQLASSTLLRRSETLSME